MDNVDEWKRIYDSKEPQLAEMPYPFEDKLTTFQKLIMIRILRPDKVLLPFFFYSNCIFKDKKGNLMKSWFTADPCYFYQFSLNHQLIHSR